MHDQIAIAQLLMQERRTSAQRPENWHRQEVSRSRRRFGRRKKI
jgi:hypothetical protein